MTRIVWWIVLGAALGPLAARAQFVGPPPFLTGVPGQVQMQSIELQRHQARTLLYREALEELRRTPAIVDVRDCAAGEVNEACLPPVHTTGVPDSAKDAPVGARRALLIGNNRYSPPIPSLLTPAQDVRELARRLEQGLGYTVTVLYDATKADIVRAVSGLARQAQAVDTVVLYYAGHGYLMDDSEMGYWIPVDGSVKTARQWLSNTDIAKLLRAIPARQVLLVSDSCFSGTLARERAVSASALPVAETLRRRSVLVLSSGGEEPVSDEGRDGHSVFAWHFLQAVDGLKATAPGYGVFADVRDGVRSDYPQTPQYGAVVAAGHEPGGDYLFMVPPGR